MKAINSAPKLTICNFKCDCGKVAEIHFEAGAHVHWTCPELQCQRVFNIEYEGRKRPYARPFEPLTPSPTVK